MWKYNVKDTTSLLIVGNGTSDSLRKNAYKLDANANGYFTGAVYTGADNKKLATEEYVTGAIAVISMDAICNVTSE